MGDYTCHVIGMNPDLGEIVRPADQTPVSLVWRMAPLALIIAIALATLGFLIVHPEGLFNRHSDLLAFHLGMQTVLYDAWRDGHRLPMWRSDVFSGAPAFANPQSMYTHPLHIPFLFVRPERVVGLVLWLHMVLGAVGGYCAGRVLRLSLPGRILVAVATLFSFKTILAAYAGWLTIIPGIAAMPLLFATAAVAFEKPSLRSTLLFGGAGALELHSGHPQFPYYAWLFVAAWAAVIVARAMVSGDRRAAIRVAGTLLLGSVVAGGLSAYLLVPIAFNSALVTRWNTSYEVFVGNRPLLPSGLLTLLNPEVLGTPLDGSFVQAWESVVYFGAMVSVLAVAGVINGRRRPYVGLLAGGVILCVALGVHTPLARLAYTLIPGFHLFRLPERVMFLAAFFIPCLAGVGLDVVLSAARTSRVRGLVAAAVIGLVAVEGTFWARRYLRVPEAAPYAPQADYLHSMNGADPAARVAPLDRALPTYGSAAPLGLQLVTGYDPFNLNDYQTFIDLLQYGREVAGEPVGAFRQPNWTDLRQISRFDMLDALNVHYLVAPSPLALPDDEYQLVGAFENQPQFQFYEGFRRGPVYVYRKQRPLGRAFFASEVVSVDSQRAAIDAVASANLRRTAVVTGRSGEGPSSGRADDRVEVTAVRPGRLELTTSSANSRFLVISEVWLPGWRALVDGRPADLSRVDIALQGLRLPPGRHRVELSYRPTGLALGLILTALSALGVTGLWLLVLYRRQSA